MILYGPIAARILLMRGDRDVTPRMDGARATPSCELPGLARQEVALVSHCAPGRRAWNPWGATGGELPHGDGSITSNLSKATLNQACVQTGSGVSWSKP